MKDRVIVCRFYSCKGKCSKRKDGVANMNGYCQKCPDYVKDKSRANSPLKVNKKQQTLRKLREKDCY